MPELAIILPMYNPHRDWEHILSESVRELDSILYDIDYSLLIVNDGSTNLNEQQIKQVLGINGKLKYYAYPLNKGKGYALRYGVSKIESDYYIYTDWDFPFGCNIIHSIFTKLRTTHNTLVIGKREKSYFVQLPYKRRFFSSVLRNINYWATGFKVVDTQAGIKGFNRSARELFLSTQTNGFLFELEFIQKCIRKNLQFCLDKIQLRPGIHFSNFGLSMVAKESLDLLKILVKN